MKEGLDQIENHGVRRLPVWIGISSVPPKPTRFSETDFPA